MHDVFGMEVLNLFDMQNGEFYIGTADDKAESTKTSKNNDQPKDLSNIDLEEVDLDAVSKETKESNDSEDATDEASVNEEE